MLNTIKHIFYYIIFFPISFLVASCSASPQSGTWKLPEVNDSVPTVTQATVLPFDSYHLSQDELRALELSKINAMSACALSYGVAVEYAGDYVRSSHGNMQWGGLFGTLDEEHASQYGYDAAPDGTWKQLGGFYFRDSSNIQPVPPPFASEAESKLIVEVTYGSSEGMPGLEPDRGGYTFPEDGCAAQVDSQYAVDLVSTADIEFELALLTLTHPRVKHAMKEWSECMKQTTGEEYDGVQKAVERFARYTQSEPSVEHIKTALADIQCTRSSRWADFFYAVLIDYQEQAIAADPEFFESVLASERYQLEHPIIVE